MNIAPAAERDDKRQPPGRYLVLIGVERFEALIQLVGPASAQGVVEMLAADVSHLQGDAVDVRVRRDHVEIVLALDPNTTPADALTRLADTLRRSVEIRGYRFERTVIIGAVDVRDGVASADAYGTAQWALTQAQLAQVPVILPHAHTKSVADDRFAMMRNLQRALRDDTLALHYQPKLHARGGEVVAAEGLLRWTCPEAGAIAPDRFIPIAEAMGDIRDLTRWVIDRAVRDVGTLAQQGAPIRLDINMSGTLLSDDAFTRDCVDRIEPVRGMIGMEITETATIPDRDRALANLRLCAEAGIRLAIDDYGAGFSSLAYLQQLPVSELKIDKSFILRLASQQRDPLLVRSTIDLAHALEMEVTAEGVDSPQVLALLQVMGCDLVQGFYLCRPQPLDALFRYLTDATERTRAPDQTIERLRQRIDAVRKARSPASHRQG